VEPAEACIADRTTAGSAEIAFASDCASVSRETAVGLAEDVGVELGLDVGLELSEGLAVEFGSKTSSEAAASTATKSAAPGTFPLPTTSPPVTDVSIDTMSPLAATASTSVAAPA
jgi:hypothetical protein